METPSPVTDERLAEIIYWHEELREAYANDYRIKEACMADDVVRACAELAAFREAQQREMLHR